MTVGDRGGQGTEVKVHESVKVCIELGSTFECGGNGL